MSAVTRNEQDEKYVSDPRGCRTKDRLDEF